MKKTLFSVLLALAAIGAQAQYDPYDPYDLNKDGNVNVGDVTTLVNFILGKEKPTPTETDAAVEAGLCPDTHHPHAIDMGDAGKWACCNVGASNPFEYGGYYAWGETEEKSEYTQNTYTHYKNGGYVVLGDISGNKEYDVATAKWGDTWRMPTSYLNWKLIGCSSEWTTMGGVNGRLFTASNGNRLFLPAAGYRYGLGLNSAGSIGYYWSSTPYPSGSSHAYYFYFYSNGADWNGYSNRDDGRCVRPVAE